MFDPLPPHFAGLPTARPEEIGLSRASLKRLGAAMTRAIEAGRAPGATMLIARHGKVGYVQTLGALKPGGEPMPADALFRIYSMTKPIVSVAAMTLVEDGRLLISDPVSDFIPEFADVKVGVPAGDGLELVKPSRPITVQDLFRHTSGLTYGFTGTSPAQVRLQNADLLSGAHSLKELAQLAAGLPLQHNPGEVWEYGLSTDVLGRVVEIVAGGRLSDILRERIFGPLGMNDTAFYTPPAKVVRRAEAHSLDRLAAFKLPLASDIEPPRLEMAGGGLLSTLADYARFYAMLAGGGSLDGARILGPRTISYMTSDHLAPHVVKTHPLLPPGYGFGLGFGVRTDPGLAPTAGTVGEFYWGGVAGTFCWASPRDALFAILMVQAPDYRDYFRLLFRNLVYAAVL